MSLRSVLDNQAFARGGDALAVGTLAVSSVDTTTDELGVTAHGLLDGDGPIVAASTGTLPAGLAANTAYYAIVVDDDTVKLATTVQHALDGVTVDLTGVGSGTITLAGDGRTVRPYVVTRRGDSSYTMGRVAAGSPSQFAIVASIQPGKNRLVPAAEGQRSESTRLVLTKSELRQRTKAQDPDVLFYQGENWEVVDVETWFGLGGSHWKATLARQASP